MEFTACHYPQTFLPAEHKLSQHPQARYLTTTKKKAGGASIFYGLANRKNPITESSSSASLASWVTAKKPFTRSMEVNHDKLKVDPGKFGGKYVPETLISCLTQLEAEFKFFLHDAKFQEELSTTLKDYIGRETPLYFVEKLTDHYKERNNGKGLKIYLKREDLNHMGAHKINNAIAQAMIAKHMGRKTIVAVTGAGQHGVATAAACAKLSLECIIFMGNSDMERQFSNVDLMKLLGAQVKTVDGAFQEATSEAIRQWVGSLATSYYLSGLAVGPHPLPTMVREFQSIIGKETRKQAMEKWGGKPDVLVACVGSGSNALGLFHEFVKDEEVRLIGVEAAGSGLDSGRHSATLALGEVGVYHGAMSYLLQDEEGLQIMKTHSIGVGYILNSFEKSY